MDKGERGDNRGQSNVSFGVGSLPLSDLCLIRGWKPLRLAVADSQAMISRRMFAEGVGRSSFTGRLLLCVVPLVLVLLTSGLCLEELYTAVGTVHDLIYAANHCNPQPSFVRASLVDKFLCTAFRRN